MSNSEQTTKAKQTAEKPKLTPEQREAQRKQALDDAAKKAVSSVTNLRAYLAVQSRFERYSTNNNLLIFAQRPDATRLKSLELWNKEKKWIREGAKAVAIYEPVRKQGKDGKTYTNFVRKNMFDISDIKDPEPDVQPTYTAAEAVQGLFAHKAVDVRMIPDYPSDRQFGAFYDAEENCVYAKRGMGYEQIFTDVAVALAHAEMAKDIEGYLPAEHQFEARCAAYVLAKKYGVSTKAVEIDRVPEEYGVMDAAGIRENLARIHDSVKNISSGMYKALVKEKEQEVSPKEKSGKGGDVFHQLCHFGACEIFDLRGKALNRAAQIAKAVGAFGTFAFLQILLSVLQTLQLVLFLCKLRLGSFLFGSEMVKGFQFCHCD